jgi:Fructose-2,6-bisphosphatase
MTSSLIRAKMTAALVSKNAPIIIDERLNERNLGIYELKYFSEYDYAKFGNMNTESNTDGVETNKEMLERISGLMEDLKKYSDKTVLLVTHGGLANAINAYIKSIGENGEIEKIRLGNCEYIEYNI